MGESSPPGWSCALFPSEELAQTETPLNGGQVAAPNVVTLSMALQRITPGVTIDVRVVEHPLAPFPPVLEHLEPRVVVAQLRDQLAIGVRLRSLA